MCLTYISVVQHNLDLSIYRNLGTRRTYQMIPQLYNQQYTDKLAIFVFRTNDPIPSTKKLKGQGNLRHS